MNICSN